MPNPYTAPHHPEAQTGREIVLTSFTYNQRRDVMPLLVECLGAAGCWMLDRRATGHGTVQFRFQAAVNATLELYTALVGAGLELTREGHQQLTALCGMPLHVPHLSHGSSVTVELAVSFMDEIDQPSLQPRWATA